MSDRARLLVFDVETVGTRNQNVVAQITEEALAKRPASNTKKEIKLQWDTEEARQARVREALEKTAVDPLLAEPIVVCWTAVDGAGFEMASGHTRLFAPEHTERALEALRADWEHVTDEGTIWVGHNIAGFDLPVLLNAWRRHRISPPSTFPVYVNGRWRGRVWDSMLRTPGKTPFVSLDAVCQAYGLGAAKNVHWQGAPMDGSRVAAAYAEGAEDLLVSYCFADVDAELNLYLAMTGGDAYGTYDDRESVAGAIREVRESELSEGAKAVAIVNIMEGAGLVPA